MVTICLAFNRLRRVSLYTYIVTRHVKLSESIIKLRTFSIVEKYRLRCCYCYTLDDEKYTVVRVHGKTCANGAFSIPPRGHGHLTYACVLCLIYA